MTREERIAALAVALRKTVIKTSLPQPVDDYVVDCSAIVEFRGRPSGGDHRAWQTYFHRYEKQDSDEEWVIAKACEELAREMVYVAEWVKELES